MKEGTRYQRPNQSSLKQKNGICIDIFVLDAMPEDDLRQRAMEYMTTLCRKVLWAPVGVAALPISIRWLSFLFLSCIPREWAFSLHQVTARWYEGKKMPCRGFFCTSFRTSRGYALNQEWYRESLDRSFEGHIFSIPNGYHEILYLKYKDYMEYPPEEERKGSSPAAYIRFSDGEEWHVSE